MIGIQLTCNCETEWTGKELPVIGTPFNCPTHGWQSITRCWGQPPSHLPQVEVPEELLRLIRDGVLPATPVAVYQPAGPDPIAELLQTAEVSRLESLETRFNDLVQTFEPLAETKDSMALCC